jgi:hypothetical protein
LTLPRLEGVIFNLKIWRCGSLRRFVRSLLLGSCVLSLFLQGMVAVAMPCDAVAVSQQADAVHAHHYAHGDEGHYPALQHEPDSDSTNCCDGGYCSVGGCVSLVAVPQNGVVPQAHALPSHAVASPDSLLSQTLSTPFRPPASA